MSKDLNKNLSDLIQQQNKLIEQQNKLLEQLVAGRKNPTEELLLPGEKIFVENLFRDEIRSGFFVTAQRKRLWNIQLNLIAELDRICQKHDIRYFAFFGTLLGAARHKGFVPWDDDVDVVMLRPDYEKFKAIIKNEISEPYFVDSWHDYKIEGEEPEANQDKSFRQFVKRDQREQHPLWWPFWPMIKLKDSRTTFAQYLDRPHVHQGIFIDVFPFDPVPPFSNNQQKFNYKLEQEILIAIALPDKIKEAAQANKKLLIKKTQLEQFLQFPHKRKALELEAFALKNFSQSEFVGQLRDHCLLNQKISYSADNFKEVVYLPFEKIKIPCPAGYKDCLTTYYGDWHKLVYTHNHSQIYSADFSYKEFFNSIKFV